MEYDGRACPYRLSQTPKVKRSTEDDERDSEVSRNGEGRRAREDLDVARGSRMRIRPDHEGVYVPLEARARSVTGLPLSLNGRQREDARLIYTHADHAITVPCTDNSKKISAVQHKPIPLARPGPPVRAASITLWFMRGVED
jgi:hypothetical protein